MPLGDYLRDERRALANLIATTPLWTERRLLDGSADGDAAGADLRPTLAVYDGQDLMTATERGEDIHRRFEVGIAGLEKWQQDESMHMGQTEVLTCRLRVGYLVGGGDNYAGSVVQLDEVAVQDLAAVRQRIWDPRNRATGTASGVTRDRTEKVDVGRFTKVRDDGKVIVWEGLITSHVIVDTEPA